MTGYKNFLTQKELAIKMSFSVQRLVVESFKFNDKNIRAVHVNGEECLVSRDVYKATGYQEENGKKAIQNLVPNKCMLRFGDVKPSLNTNKVEICLHRDTVLLTGNDLKLFLMRCRKPKAFDVAKHFGIKIEHCLPVSKEQDTLSQIMQAFRGEEMIHQFGAGKYRIDLYFPKYKWAFECDEFDHRDRDIGYEVERQKHIEKLLNCTFVRFNLDAEDFCILGVVNKTFVQIKSSFQMRIKICHHLNEIMKKT